MVPFGANGVALQAGDILDYGVNNDGNFLNDSTGLALTFNAVPEPAAWTMMLIGFAAIGGALRRKADRRTPAAT